MRIIVINGPNLNMIGIREPEIYGRQTYDDLVAFIKDAFEEAGVEGDIYQSNHEGEIVDFIQQAYQKADGIVLNAGAYTHTSIAILDALKAVDIPTVEVHLTDTENREAFRKTSYVSIFAERMIKGKGFEGYREAIRYLAQSGRNEDA
ncbi:MAG: type II 3-dehydroquinate dehydratase [Clostridiales bacterium]|nr:type II 3-dehydroquinate dehydratase [Clostridiales bacterium]MBQ3321658.1 type II 3-dehydroquinate dehydratase [Bacillota bacterium]